MQNKSIFISHSSKDKVFATWLSNLLISLGANPNTIFYSSDFRQGVREKISDEVYQALKDTAVDIVILSNEYKQSEYCLNEAGIIWFKNKESDRIVIVLPSICGRIQAGFIDDNYNQYRLLSEDFFEALVKRLQEELSKHGLLQTQPDFPRYNELIKTLEEYKRSLPIIKNLEILYPFGGNKEEKRKEIEASWQQVQKIGYKNQNPPYQYIFYEKYIRQIQLDASDRTQGQIRVITKTTSSIVNLSNEAYVEVYSSQFLREDGGYSTFEESFLINSEPIKNIVRTNDYQAIVDNPYLIHKGPEITVPAHSSCLIEYTTQYDIEPELFFQSKILGIPCGNYLIEASFKPSFVKHFGDSYIFRSQFIPPNPNNLRDRSVPVLKLAEATNKQYIRFVCSSGFPAGGGYVLTLSKVKDIT